MTRSQSASQSTPDPNTIYCSVEVSRSSWIVGVHCPLTDTNIGIHKLPPGGGNDLIDLVRKSQARVGSDVPVMLCYEVSYEGFWLVRYLERQAPDIEVVVLDPASLQVDRRFKKVKTDRLDAERMIRALKAWHAGDGESVRTGFQPCILPPVLLNMVKDGKVCIVTDLHCSVRYWVLLDNMHNTTRASGQQTRMLSICHKG